MSVRDAEEAVLSAMLMDPRAITAVAQIVSPDSFEFGQHRAIYRAMREMASRATEVDPLTLSHELETQGELEKCGGKDFIGYLIDAVPTSVNVEYHAKIVRLDAQKRDLIATLKFALEMASAKSADPADIATQLQQSLLSVAVERNARGYRNAGDVLAETLVAIKQRQDNARENIPNGVLTGFPEIDNVTNGYQPGELIIVAGGPKSGKTMTALAWLLYNVLYGDGAGIVSAEMTGMQLAERMLNSVGMVRAANTASGNLSPEEWQRLFQAGGDITRAGNLHIDDEAFPSLGDVIARGLHLKSKHPKLKVLGVDYLQLVSEKLKGRALNEEISAVCHGLKGLAKRTGMAVIAMCQTNFKEHDKRSTGKPALYDVQGSSGPAQDADFVWLVNRPSLSNPDPMLSDLIEYELGASRRTDRFTVRMRWNGSYMRVESARGKLFSVNGGAR